MRRLRGSVPYGIPGRGGGLFSLPRLRRSACGVFFSCLYILMERIFYAQAAGILAWCHFGLSQGLSHASRGPLIYAQDAWIRLRHFFHMVVYTSGACILCAGCGDPRLLHFGFSLGMPCGLSMSLWWLRGRGSVHHTTNSKFPIRPHWLPFLGGHTQKNNLFVIVL